jgi:hypothetical protein
MAAWQCKKKKKYLKRKSQVAILPRIISAAVTERWSKKDRKIAVCNKKMRSPSEF